MDETRIYTNIQHNPVFCRSRIVRIPDLPAKLLWLSIMHCIAARSVPSPVYPGSSRYDPRSLTFAAHSGARNWLLVTLNLRYRSIVT